MAIVNSFSLFQDLNKILGLPEHTTKVTITMNLDEPVMIETTSYMNLNTAYGLQSIVRKFKLQEVVTEEQLKDIINKDEEFRAKSLHEKEQDFIERGKHENNSDSSDPSYGC